MDILERFLLWVFSFLRIQSENALHLVSAIVHAGFVYLILISFGIALFVPSSSFVETSIYPAALLTLAYLLGLSEWSERKITKTTAADELVSIILSVLSIYLAAVGILLLVLMEFGFMKEITIELLSVCMFVVAFLLYCLSDLPQLLEERELERSNRK